MSQPLPRFSQQGFQSQNSSNKAQQNKQIPIKMQYAGQNDPEPTGQKKQEDNDYQSEYKLTVKQKFQQKLKHDQTDCIFTIILNEIIEERIRKNYSEEEVSIPTDPQPNPAQEINQQVEPSVKNVSSELDKLKTEDQKVKKRIKQLLKKRPNKKVQNYELDPNRDKGFILAKKMNEIKQQREKKYLKTKKQFQAQKNQLIQSQMSTITCIQNFSMQLARRGNRRYTKEIEDSYKLPRILQNDSFMNENDKYNRSRLRFADFLSKNKSLASQNPENSSFSYQNYQNLALSARSNYDQVKTNKKRDQSREIEILRKSQKITQKYQIRKIASDILIDVILNAVRLLQKKKEFYFNAPPKPVHQMIRNYKDKNGKTVWIPGSKPEKFRINTHLKQIRKEKSQGKKSQSDNIEQESNVSTAKNLSRISQVRHTIDVSVDKDIEKSKESLDEEDESLEKERKGTQENENKHENQKNEKKQENKKKNYDNQFYANKQKKINDNAQKNDNNPQILIQL